MDLWQLIASYQANILQLAEEVAGAVGRGPRGRERLFRELDRELERYMDAMETVIHPALADDPRTAGYVAELEQEHAEIREHMDELAAAPSKDGREWTRRFRALAFALGHYFSLQEHGAFTVARGTLGDQAQALRRAFAREQIASLQAQRWHVPKAIAPGRYGLSVGAALGLVLGVLTLAVAAVTLRQRSSGAPFDAWDVKRRSQDNRALRERDAALAL